MASCRPRKKSTCSILTLLTGVVVVMVIFRSLDWCCDSCVTGLMDSVMIANSETERIRLGAPSPKIKDMERAESRAVSVPDVVHLATVACGQRRQEGLVLLKSAAALTVTSHLVLHVFTEKKHHKYFLQALAAWPQEVQDRVDYRLYDITFPDDPDAKEWDNPKWAPCSNHRLFLHSYLPDTDAVLYLDSDTLLLSPADLMWDVFAQFTSSHMLGLARETESRSGGWYAHHSKVPYVLPAGLNSGVILMNLTRMRRSDWTKSIVQYSKTYRGNLTWIDQDLIGLYLHFHPDKLYLLDCARNYRSDHCMKRLSDNSSVCKSAETDGAFILHGSRRAFQRGKSQLNVVYQTFKQYRIGGNLTRLLEDTRSRLKEQRSPCTAMTDVFLKRLAKAAADAQDQDHIKTSHTSGIL